MSTNPQPQSHRRRPDRVLPAGWRVACFTRCCSARSTYPHGVDRYVELDPPAAARTTTCAPRSWRCATRRPKSVTLTLRPNANWRGLPRRPVRRRERRASTGFASRGPTRPPAPSTPTDGTLELTVSTHPDGQASRGTCATTPAPGMIVDLTQAQGEFVLPDPRPESVLLISGGSGITPVMAMLRTLCDEGFDGEIGFLNYARSPTSALYEAELRSPRASAIPGFRSPRGYTRGARGASSAGASDREHLSRRDRSTHAAAATFVCGPPPLIDAVARDLGEEGLPQPAVETFTAPAARARRRAPRAASSASRASGREAPNSGLPLLEQAEDAGLAPDHGCRMGICNTCSCRKSAGAVRNLHHRRRSRPRRRGADPHLRLGARRRRRARPLDTSRTRRSAPCRPSAPTHPRASSRHFGQELDAIRAAVVADLGQRDVDYINRLIHAQRGLEVAGRGLLFARLPAARLARRHRRAVAVEDPRQHGDRPQRHARPIRLDGGPAPQRQGRSSGTRPARATSGATPTTTCTTPSRTSSARTATSATASCACPRMSSGAPTTSATCSGPALLALFFQYGVALHDLESERIVDRRGDSATRSGGCSARSGARSAGQTLKDYVLFPLLSGPSLPFVLAGNADGEPDPQPVGVHDHLLRPLPGRHPAVHRAGGRGARPAASGTTASCSARPTSPAARCSTSSPGT